MSRDWRALTRRQLARAPNAVDVRCAGKRARGPLDVVAPELGDGSSARVRDRGFQLVLIDEDLPEAVVNAIVTCTSDHDEVETRYRVHDRFPTEDALTHVLLLAQVTA